MNIVKVEIYGYGKVIQQSLTFDRGLNAVFGLNEAGKTTWMDFIRHVLFGFPTKKSNARQYLPKRGGVCGGCLYLDTKRYGFVKVERILTAQKVTGEVSVFLADGIEKDELFLPELLDGMTEQIFLNVFHFGLEGLQEMQQRKGEDISDFLFATAVFGEKTRSQFVENKEKEMKQLFKGRGKSKIGNELEVLEQSYTDLQAWKKKEQAYQGLLIKREQLQAESKEKKSEIRRNQTELEKLRQSLTIHPTLTAYQTVKQRVEKLEGEGFVDADTRKWLKETLEHKEALEREIQKAEENLQRIEGQMHGTSSDYFFHLQEIPFKEDVSCMEKIELAIENCNDRLKENEQKLQSLMHDLGEYIDQEFLQALPNQFFMREQLKQLIQKYESLAAEVTQNHETIKGIESEIQERQLRIQQVQQQPLEDGIALRKELDIRNRIDECERNLEQLRAQKMARSKEQNTQSNKIGKGRKSPTQIALSGSSILLAMVILIIGVVEGDWLIVGISLLLPLVLLLQMLQKKDTALSRSMEDYLSVQMSGLEMQLEKLKNPLPRQKAELLEKLARVEESKSEITSEQKALMYLQPKWHTQKQVIEQKIQERQLIQRKAQEILQGLWLPTEHLSMALVEYLDSCFTLKQYLQQKNRLQDERLSLEKQYQECLRHWEEQFHSFSQSRGSFDRLVRDWEMYKAQMNRKNAQNEQVALQYLTYLSSREQLIQKRIHLEKQLQHVYEHTSFQDAEGFIQEDERWQLYQRERTKKAELYKQLEYFFMQSGYQETDLEIFDSLEEKVQHIEEQLEEAEQDLVCHQNELTAVDNQIYEIEVGAEKFQYQSAYDYHKGILYEDIFEWLVLAQMMDQFQSVMDTFRKDKMPRVLERVSAYFREMTCGAYEKVEICTDIQRFIVQNKQEIRFEVQELSRGTKEQLYTALRLAMAEVSPFQVKIPFIIDDSFVNFDRERLVCALQVLKGLSEQFQIIYFTCNSDVYDSISHLTGVIQPKIS